MIYYGGKVDLRTVGEVPGDLLIAWRNDYKIWKFCRQNDLIPFGAHLHWLENQRQGIAEAKMYGVFNHKSDEPVGVCGLTSIDQGNRRAEFSLYIAPKYQKKGFGRHALNNLFNHGFGSLNLNCIWGESFSYNPARELFKFMGMKEEGCRRSFYFKNGEYVDAYLYSLLREEWTLEKQCFT